MMQFARFALALTFVGVVTACGKSGSSSAVGSSSAAVSSVSVKDQCASLIKANEAGYKKLTGQKDTDDLAKDSAASSKIISDWSADLGKLNIDDPPLKKLVTDQQAVLKEMSGAMSALASIAKNPDEKKMNELEKKMDVATKSADSLDEKIETYCTDK
jgi:hypothetical protein